MGTDDENLREGLINIFIPDYYDIIDEINNLTDGEVDILLEYHNDLDYDLPDSVDELSEYIISFVQDKFIKDFIKCEFVDVDDYFKFLDEYEEEIEDFSLYSGNKFLDRICPGTYKLIVSNIPLVEKILADNDINNNWNIKKNIRHLETINELNRYNDIKFVI